MKIDLALYTTASDSDTQGEMARSQGILVDVLDLAFDAGVANPRGTLIFTLVNAVAAAVLHYLWHPFGPLNPFMVFFLGVICAVGTAGLIKGFVVRKARLRRLYSQDEIEDLQRLTWPQFEQLVADAYRAKGYVVSERGGQGDRGIDLMMRSPSGERVAVQCKHWREWQVGAPRIREFAGAMVQARVSRGIFVTSGRYSEPARDSARRTSVELVDGWGLLELIRSARP